MVRSDVIRNVVAAACLPAALVFTGSAGAATNAELEQRLERLERELAAEKKEKKDKKNAKFDGLLSNTEINIGGYVKLDLMHSSYSDSPAGNGRGRAFYIPALVPASEGTSDGVTDLQARETRVNLGTVTETGGHKIETFIEIDFFGDLFDSAAANKERLVNGSDPRMRHAFIRWNDTWLFGQTWSNFMDLSAYPENLDFVGPSEGLAFIRQAQIRYTNGPLSFSLENPESTIGDFGTGARNVSDNNSAPDVTAAYKSILGGGNHIRFAALARQLDGDDIPGVAGRDKAFAYGVNVSGKFMLGMKDDIRYQINYGDGVGRYIALNTTNGAVIDANGDLETIEAVSGYISLRHFWSAKWRSNLTLGHLSVDNDTNLTGTGVTDAVSSVHANLLYQPVEKLTLGGEYLFAQRELENGNEGDLGRFIFSAKYAF